MYVHQLFVSYKTSAENGANLDEGVFVNNKLKISKLTCLHNRILEFISKIPSNLQILRISVQSTVSSLADKNMNIIVKFMSTDIHISFTLMYSTSSFGSIRIYIYGHTTRSNTLPRTRAEPRLQEYK